MKKKDQASLNLLPLKHCPKCQSRNTHFRGDFETAIVFCRNCYYTSADMPCKHKFKCLDDHIKAWQGVPGTLRIIKI